MYLKVLSIKHLTTVQWNSRETCLKVFCSRYDPIMQVLQKIQNDPSFEDNKRACANGLHQSFLSKEITATARIFQEVFAVTGPLSNYLQSTDVDIGKANDLVDGCFTQLKDLCERPETIMKQVESCFENTNGKK